MLFGSSRSAILITALAVALLLRGCSGEQEQSPTGVVRNLQETCYLDVFQVPAVASSDRAHARRPTLRAFIDVSGSMPGYGAPETNDGYTSLPYRNLIGALLDYPDIETFGFANEIGPATPFGLAALARGIPGACASCGRSETRLNDVLNEIAEDRSGSVSAVVTDLWLANSEILGNGARTYIDPVEAIHRSGRVIGVLGVRAPYEGSIYDMPDGGSFDGGYNYRPIFLLIIGLHDDVERIFDEVRRSALIDEAEENWRYSLYAGPRPAADIPAVLSFRPSVDVATTAQLLDDAAVPAQFEINGAEIARLGRDAASSEDRPAAGIEILFDPAAGVAPDSVVRAEIVVSAQSFGLADASLACFEEAWFEGSASAGAVRSTETGLVYDMIDPEVSAMPAGFVYAVQLSFSTAGVRLVSDEDAWLADWSFSAVEAPELRSRNPEVFPVLNLTQLRLVLRDSVQRAGRDGVLARGTFLYRVEN